MSIGAIARGVLAGNLRNREADAAEEERRRRREIENIELMDRLSNMEGFSFEDDEPPDDATGSGEPDELPALPVEEISDGRGGPTTQQGIEPAIPPVGERPKAPRTAMEIARITIGGRERGVRFDPTQTPAAKRARRDQLNRAAHAASSPDEEYDEGRDYVAEQRERKRDEAEIAATTQAIIDSGIETDPKKARAWAVANPTLDKITKARAPRAPVRGSPEYEQMLRRESAIPTRRGAGGGDDDDGTPAQRRAVRVRSATGWATRWADMGDDAEKIARSLAKNFPDLSSGERNGIAVAAVRSKAGATRAEKAAERAASGTGGRGGAYVTKARTAAGVPARSGAAAAESTAVRRDKGEAPDSVVRAALRKFGGDEAKAEAYLRGQGYQ